MGINIIKIKFMLKNQVFSLLSLQLKSDSRVVLFFSFYGIVCPAILRKELYNLKAGFAKHTFLNSEDSSSYLLDIGLLKGMIEGVN